jgi:EmrB/QacA subfamily drug resistance transporter
MSDSVQALFDTFGPKYRWIATVTAMSGAIAIVLSSTIVNVAVPDVMGTFGVGLDQAQWIATGFLAAMTVFQLVTAWLVERVGIRAAYMGTLVLFAAGAVLGAIAPNMATLAIGRIMQGAAGGVVLPLSMIVIALVFPPERKGFAMGIFSMGTVLAPAIGPVLGGIAVDTYGWRYMFFIPLPMCLITFVLASRFLPTRSPNQRQPLPFDLFGLLLLAAAILLFLIITSNGQRWGWLSDRVLVLAIATAGLALTFVMSQLRSEAPLLDFSVLKNSQFASASFVAFIFGAGLFATTYYIPVFVQSVMSFTATQAGLLLAPSGFLLMVVFPLAGRLADSVPAHYLIVGGLIVLSYGFALLAGADTNTTFFTLVIMTLVGRLGLGFIMPPLNTAALRALPPTQLNRGSGTINFFRQLGGAVGVSALVVAVEQRAQVHSAQLSATQTSDNETSRQLLEEVARLLAEAGVPQAAQHSSALDYLGRMVFAQANSQAFQDAAMIIAWVFLLTVLPALLLARGKTTA